MQKYDLSSYGAICAAVKEAKKAEDDFTQSPTPHEPTVYPFLRGYRRALEDVSEQLAPQQRLLDTLINYLGKHHDSSELYQMFHEDMGMSDEEISFLGFDLPQCSDEIDMPEQADPNVTFLINDLKDQLVNKKNETAYGEPQAWADLSNGRSIEVTLEQELLDEKDYYFSVRLHCTEKEQDNHDFNQTNGVIDQFISASSFLDELDRLVLAALSCNDRFPIAEHSLEESKPNKMSIAWDIGRCYGKFFEENNQFCIDNDEKVFRYDTVDELLKDWLDTIIISHHDECHFDEQGREWDSWEDEILFIYENVIGNYPDGILCVTGNNGVTWPCSIDVPVPGSGPEQNKTFALGTYPSIVDAIYAQQEFQEAYENNKTQDLEDLAGIADKIREKSTAMEKLSFADDIGYTEFEVSALWYQKRSDIDAVDLFHMACADDSSCLNDLTGKYYEEMRSLSDQIQSASTRATNNRSADKIPTHEPQL